MTPIIEQVFGGIPANEILAIARKYQAVLESDSTIVQSKGNGEFVTRADTEIQNTILEYFKASAIADTYLVKAEEVISSDEDGTSRGRCEFQLIVDPLDGTNAFCDGSEKWGSMVGLCDSSGKLVYSWNVVSNGAVFTSDASSLKSNRRGWDEVLKHRGELRIDLCDYNAGAADAFLSAFQRQAKSLLSDSKISMTSQPAAVWAGWELFTGESDGLLWLPSSQGKRSYPDYDLIFLGALQAQGWNVSLGKRNDEVLMVVVAPGEKESEMLWSTGITLIPDSVVGTLGRVYELCITSSIEATRS